MSTRGFIAYPTSKGIRGIYCHYDSYPGHVGRLLAKFHNTKHAAEQLVENGQIRLFQEDGSVELFHEGDYEEYESAAAVLETHAGYDYVYVFINGEWKCWTLQEQVVNVDIPQPEPEPQQTFEQVLNQFIKTSDAKYGTYAHATGYLSGMLTRLALDGHISEDGMKSVTEQLNKWVAEA